MLASLHLDAASVARNPDAVAQALKATETLEGILDQILFVNDKNGYSVAVVVVPQEHGDFRRVTVVGNLAGLEVGSTIRAVGGFQNHQRFGDQFHVVDYEIAAARRLARDRALPRVGNKRHRPRARAPHRRIFRRRARRSARQQSRSDA